MTSWLNPALRAADYAEAYARDGVVQIEGLLAPEVANALEDVLTVVEDQQHVAGLEELHEQPEDRLTRSDRHPQRCWERN